MFKKVQKRSKTFKNLKCVQKNIIYRQQHKFLSICSKIFKSVQKELNNVQKCSWLSLFSFQMNGRSLCQLTRDQFTERTHWAGGDILFEHLSILQQEAEQKLINNANQQGPLDYSPSTNGNAVVLPLYPDHYQPPAHVYNHNSYQQQHHFEQYHYGFQHIPQGYPVIPPPHSMPYYRPYTVSKKFH